MKKVKQLKGWGIFELSQKERSEYGFTHAVVTPENMECYSGSLTPNDTDMEINSIDEAVNWICNY